MALMVPVTLLSLPQQTLCYTWKAELWKQAEKLWAMPGAGMGQGKVPIPEAKWGTYLM